MFGTSPSKASVNNSKFILNNTNKMHKADIMGNIVQVIETRETFIRRKKVRRLNEVKLYVSGSKLDPSSRPRRSYCVLKLYEAKNNWISGHIVTVLKEDISMVCEKLNRHLIQHT